MKSSIDAATKMANMLGVSLDWLVGNTDAELDAAALNRIQDTIKPSQKDKELVFVQLLLKHQVVQHPRNGGST